MKKFIKKLAKKIGSIRCCGKDKFFYLSLVLLVVCAVAIATQGFTYNFVVQPKNAAQVKNAMKYIATNFLNDATSTINSVSMKGGLYYIKFTINSPQGNQEAEAYVNVKGTLIFPSAIEMKPSTATTTPGQPAPTAEIPKKDVVDVRLFVMSFCPFGNQAEYNILPVVKLLGSSVDIIPQYIVTKSGDGTKLENYSSLHGMTELKQNVRELCVRKYDKAKYWDFVDAINKGCTNADVDTCWSKIAQGVGLDTNKIETCLTNEGPTLLAKEAAAGTEYNAQSSPMMFINKVNFNGGRTPEAYKTAICGAFTDAKKPAACATKLQETDATPGAAAGAPATSGAGCAPAQ